MIIRSRKVIYLEFFNLQGICKMSNTFSDEYDAMNIDTLEIAKA